MAHDKSRAEPCRRRYAADGKADHKEVTSPEEGSVQYLRVRRDKDQEPTALETSITRFVGKNNAGADVFVDLVGAVHVGEKDYYEQLNELFTVLRRGALRTGGSGGNAHRAGQVACPVAARSVISRTS